MSTVQFPIIQEEIRRELNVVETSDEDGLVAEINRRVEFLKNYLKSANAKTYVLGISGGIDSATAGIMAQYACEELREEGYECKFIAVRLPYGTQRDEAEAMQAIKDINPDSIMVVNIKPAADALMDSLSHVSFTDAAQTDFVKGNVKARQRMIAQYAIAGATGGLVIGTDQGPEALMGFFTKFGDGACDLTPLTGLTKRQVRAIGKYLGISDTIVNKVPTADLEDLDPGKPDEVAYGLTYDNLDDYLEGKYVPPDVEQKIIDQFTKTCHKRSLPVTPFDSFFDAP